MVWRTNKPIEADRVKNLGGVIRDNKTAVKAALEQHFYLSTSVSSAGIARFSNTSGACRAYYGAASVMSVSAISSLCTGKLWMDSTNTRLYMLDSNNTTMVGSGQAIIRDLNDLNTPVSNSSRILVQFGVITGKSDAAAVNTSFTTIYQTIPRMTFTPKAAGIDELYTTGISTISTGGFTSHYAYEGNVDPDAGGMYWRAEGPVSV